MTIIEVSEANESTLIDVGSLIRFDITISLDKDKYAIFCYQKKPYKLQRCIVRPKSGKKNKLKILGRQERRLWLDNKLSVLFSSQQFAKGQC